MYINYSYNKLNRTSPKKASYVSLLILLLLFFSNDTLLYGTNNDIIYMYISTMMLLCMAFMFFISSLYNKPINQNQFTLLLTIILLNCLTMLIREDFSEKYIYEMLLVILAFLIVKSLGDQQYEQQYVNVMIFLSIFSVVFFYASRFFLIPSFQVTNETGYVFNNYIFTNILISPRLTPRNYGVFREPGVYQLFLNLAFYFNNHKDLKCKGRLWKNIVLVFTIFTTLSTAGYIVLATLMFFFLWNNSNKKIKIVVFISIVFLLVVFALLQTMDIIDIKNIAFFSKFSDEDTSFVSRISGFIKNIYIAYHYPVLGAGYDFMISNYSAILRDSFSASSSHNTNTVLKLFAIHGIIYGVIFVIGFVKYCKIYEKGFKAAYIFVVVFIFCFSNEDMSYNIIIYFMAFLGFYRGANIHEENLSYKYMR